MESTVEEVNIAVHNLPAVIMLEVFLPTKLVDDLNTYLDEYRKTADKKSLAPYFSRTDSSGRTAINGSQA